MNEAQRAVLLRHQQSLASDLIVSEELFACLFQKKVFERPMLETIKAEKTPTEQVYKLLSLLPRRGPEAFDGFIEVLKLDYPWLATALESSYRTAVDQALSRQNSLATLPICTCGGVKTEQPPEVTPRQATDVPADPDIKGRVGTFIHKVFGQSKRVSQQDKKMMEKWFSEQIQIERKKFQKKMEACMEEGASDTNEQSTCTSPVPSALHDNLRRTFEKVRDENLCDLLNQQASDGVNEATDCDEPDGRTVQQPDDIQAVVNNLEGEVDKLINKLNTLDKLVDRCHYILGDPERKHNLATLVKDLQIMEKHYERELQKEKDKAEKMLTELYDYCKSINKMESQRNQQRHLMKEREEMIKKLETENVILLEKCKNLEASNLQHIEKEKTLDNLRKMVANLQASHGSLVDENANYRGGYPSHAPARTYRRPGIRAQNRRGSIHETNANSTLNKKGLVKSTITLTNARRKPQPRM